MERSDPSYKGQAGYNPLPSQSTTCGSSNSWPALSGRRRFRRWLSVTAARAAPWSRASADSASGYSARRARASSQVGCAAEPGTFHRTNFVGFMRGRRSFITWACGRVAMKRWSASSFCHTESVQ